MESTSAATANVHQIKASGHRRSVLRDRKGSVTLEYALLTALITIAVIVGLTQFGHSVSEEFALLSRQFVSSDIPGHCQRVEWTDAALTYHVTPKHSREAVRSP